MPARRADSSRCEPELAIVYDAARDPARRARRHPLPAPRRRPRRSWPRCASGRSACSSAPTCRTHGDRLNANGFVWDMLIQHEHQHNETMLQTLQLAEPGVSCPRAASSAGAAAGDSGAATVHDPWRPVRDGRPRRRLRLRQRAPAPRASTCRPSSIDRDAGDQRRLRRVRGRRRLRPPGAVDARRAGSGAWREEARAAAVLDRGRARAPLRPGRADRPATAGDARVLVRGRRLRALARGAAADRGRVGEGRGWRGRAAAIRGATSRRRPRGPTSTSSPSGRSPSTRSRAPLRTGVRGLLGDCWEWTASDFARLPRLRSAFPYPEYSEVFFGARYKVLRGASWATRPSVARNTFRNWDLPAAAPDLRRLPLRAGSGRARDPDRLPHRTSVPDTLVDDVRDGLTRDAQGAAAQVLLRRARLGAVRPHHHAARVLPHPLRARDPQPPRARDRLRLPGAGRAGLGDGVEDARAAVRDGGRGHAAALRARSMSTPRWSRRARTS